MAVFDPRKMLLRSVPILTLLIAIEMAGGVLLGKGYENIRPAFLVLLPPFLAVGGNVGSVLGSRISSALHLGLVTPSLSGAALRANVFALAVSGIVAFGFLGIFTHALSSVMGIAELGLGVFLLVTLLSGTCLTAFTITVSLWTCFASFRRGLDPDDVVVPVVATLTDIAGIVLLLAFLGFFGR